MFSISHSVGPTGILPRLLIVSPLLFLGWIGLLYLSLPLGLLDTLILGATALAGILTLTYLSCVGPPTLAWVAVLSTLLGVVSGLGRRLKQSLASFILTIVSLGLPVLGLLANYSGLTLNLAALLSVTWLSVGHWYGQSQ